MSGPPPAPQPTIDRARLVARDKLALGGAVSLFEDPRAAAAGARAALLADLPAAAALVVGVTGAPGVGKSTLIGELAVRLHAGGRAVAVLAVDPSSPTSGGALLGDRARVRFPPGEDRLYFRSQPSALELGGLAPASYPVVRLLARLFDVVIVETVGVGQSEVVVSQLADLTLVVIQPLTGDQLQFIKAGVMEIADLVVLAKADLAEAGRVRGQLAGALAIGRDRPPELFAVSARSGAGIDGLVARLTAAAGRPGRTEERAAHFLARWIVAEFGRSGLDAAASRGGATALLTEAGSFEAAQAGFPALYRAWLGD